MAAAALPSLYFHFEAAPPEFTLKLSLGSEAPKTVARALDEFARAYALTGMALAPSSLSLSTADGAELPLDALLPCGLPPSSDLFVRSAVPPSPADAAAVEAADVAVEEAARGESARRGGPSAAPRVYAKEGSAIAASQAKMGENSYYYSVGKNKGTAAAVASPVAVVTIAADAKPLKEVTIANYSMLDDDAKVKVNIPMAGAASLPDGAINAVFRDRSFDIRVTNEGKCFRLHVPILLEEINQRACSCRKRQGKLIVILEKRDPSKSWYELRKTKGIGDTEYSKIVPDSGEAFEFCL